MAMFTMFAVAAVLAGGESVAIAQAVSERQARWEEVTRARREVCYALATGPAQLNLADCQALESAPEPVFRAQLCNFLHETGQLEDFGFVSHTGCIRYGFVR